MVLTRREFGLAAVAAGVVAAGARGATKEPHRRLVKPPRLRKGDTVGLVNPALAVYDTEDIESLKEAIEASLGLEVRFGPHFFDRRGYLAGRDEDRASDINAFAADPAIKAIFATGGWGSARLLPLIDYEQLRRQPKVFLGYSDVTSLLLAIHARTGLVTFHGPHPIDSFSTEHLKRVLFAGEAVSMANPRDAGPVQFEHRVQTLVPGRARGRILGGSLTILSTVMGSDYLPSFEGSILFVEDEGEQLYRIDRMLTQLKLAGVLEQLRGFIFGSCTDCGPGEGYGSLTLEEILRDHIVPLGVPAWHGSMLGHLKQQFTVGEGVEVEVDAQAGTIRMLEPAVV